MSLTNNLKIAFEDESIVVFDKPVGLIVNSSETAKGETLQDFVANKYSSVAEVDDQEFVSRNGIVHRLDKDTSGLVIVAKTPEAFYHLKNQFMAREMDKEYLAILWGKLTSPIVEIDAPVGRNLKVRTKMMVVKDGRQALTKIVLVKNAVKDSIDISAVRVYPKTGRTHQIRVHAAAINNPVIGDNTYMTRKQFTMASPLFNRLMLHAHMLTFKHPIGDIEKTIYSEMPLEFVPYYSKYT